MPKLQKPVQKVTEKDLAKKLAVQTEEVVTKPKLGRPKKAETPVPAPAVKEETQGKANKVTSIADKKAAKAEKPTPAPVKELPKAQKPATKPAPVVQDETEGEMDWEDIFDEVIDGKNFSYLRQDDVDLAFMQENLPKFNVHMLVAEPRDDGKFSNMVLCFVSKETFTFIDQTGGEDMDSLVQVEHDEVIGQREFKVKKRTFPFAIYLKQPKAGKKK